MAPILRLGAGVAVALVLLPVAGSGGAAGSGLYGTVKKGPVKPVCQQGVPCDGPAQVTLVFTRTSPDGTFQSAQIKANARSPLSALFGDLPSLDELERRYLLHVLETSSGNRTRAAEIMGIDRRTLYRMIERYRIDGEAE